MVVRTVFRGDTNAISHYTFQLYRGIELPLGAMILYTNVCWIN
jgi:hypothetical protein